MWKQGRNKVLNEGDLLCLFLSLERRSRFERKFKGRACSDPEETGHERVYADGDESLRQEMFRIVNAPAIAAELAPNWAGTF